MTDRERTYSIWPFLAVFLLLGAVGLAGILVVGAGFLWSAFAGAAVQPRIAVQAAIFIALGLGGLAMSRAQLPARNSR